MLRETFINDNNRQVSVWQYEEISAYNEKMNTNYDYSEHEEKGWNKEDTVKCIKDSLIGLAAITLLTMLVAFLRFAFVAKVDSKYLWAYTVEYPKLVFKWIVVLWILWIIIHLIYKAVTHKRFTLNISKWNI